MIRRDVKLQVSGTTAPVVFDVDVRQKAEFTIDETQDITGASFVLPRRRGPLAPLYGGGKPVRGQPWPQLSQVGRLLKGKHAR
jgi:hypothetical protein